MKRKIFVLLMCCISVFAFGQRRASELGVTLDNDLFTSTVNDQYYTNGIEIYYRFLDKNTSEKVHKKISEIKIGQYIYNPQTIKATDIKLIDRPFAGYLFAQYGKNWFYNNESVFKINFQAGVVGPNSYAEEVQKLIHNTFGYKSVVGWKFQIKNTLALQTGILYSHKLFPNTFSQNMDFHLKTEANVGTAFDGASIGLLSRISLKKLLPVYDSNLYGAALNEDPSFYETQSEFYFYINPSVNYQLYDATIQGSLFHSDSPVTFDVTPFRFNGEAGFRYRKNHLNLSYVFVYRGKEAKNDQIRGYFYGSIGIGYFLN